MFQRARRLRSEMTGPERILWSELRDRRFAGWKFRRQVPLGPYVVDFYCHNLRLIIEIDGDSHIDRFQQDQAREDWLRLQGYSILRSSNDDVLKDLDNILAALERFILSR
jgi:very-short-patch-repair endonuclease